MREKHLMQVLVVRWTSAKVRAADWRLIPSKLRGVGVCHN